MLKPFKEKNKEYSKKKEIKKFSKCFFYENPNRKKKISSH